ncbi:unnamed protein product [Ilex paraguariensis]|uniref:UBC core domain-containing protein n=1 Tax=Ilex paraguariensis TaxID=185542 RepID=A0ABC8RU25_9AQUA
MTSPSASSRKALSKIACNRLQKELVEWQVNPPAGFKHKVTDNLQRWVIEVNGAPGTLYANEMYQLQVDFPEHYPMEAPQVVFTPPAPLHPHIYSNGHICLGLSGRPSLCRPSVHLWPRHAYGQIMLLSNWPGLRHALRPVSIMQTSAVKVLHLISHLALELLLVHVSQGAVVRPTCQPPAMGWAFLS